MVVAVLSTLTMGAAAAYLVGEWRQHAPTMWIAKPLASAAFVATAVAAGAAGTGHGKVILAALVLSAIGDVALVPRGQAAFLVGLGSFLAAHVAFAAAFFVRGVATAPLVLAALALALPGILVYLWLAPHLAGAMRGAVLAYMAALTVMVASAVASSALVPSAPLVAGAFAFWLSDLSVARDRLVREGLVNRLWGVPLYYAAQLLLAGSAAA